MYSIYTFELYKFYRENEQFQFSMYSIFTIILHYERATALILNIYVWYLYETTIFTLDDHGIILNVYV